MTLVVGPTRYSLPRWRLAKMLDLSTLRFTGPVATAYFAKLDRSVDRPPKDARFAVGTKGIYIVPSEDGVALNVPASAERVLAAAKRLTNRVATLVVSPAAPSRTTAAAQAMGITGTVGSYQTEYGGDPNRIHNVDLVAHLVDGKLIAPGATFSFNETTGERSAAKGFVEAPVIVNGELQTGLGGGVCQVSTTVFNAAYEAGLQITERTNHALYISHYPLGRDATVDYPDIDLKFVNDTGHWLLLRTFVNPGELSVVLYGTPQNRKVVSEAQPLTVVAAPPVQKTIDATLKPGETVVDDPGVPATSTSVERKVYAPDGHLLSDQTWYSSYQSQPKIVRVGPKKKKKPERRRRPGLRRRRRRRLRRSNRLLQPRRYPGRPHRLAVDGRVRGPAVGDQPSVALDRVVVVKACAAHVAAARVHRQPVVEARRLEVADVRLEHDRLEAEVAEPLVAAGVRLEVGDARHLEPDEVVRVVHDALCVGLGEADTHVG